MELKSLCADRLWLPVLTKKKMTPGGRTKKRKEEIPRGKERHAPGERGNLREEGGWKGVKHTLLILYQMKGGREERVTCGGRIGWVGKRRNRVKLLINNHLERGVSSTQRKAIV